MPANDIANGRDASTAAQAAFRCFLAYDFAGDATFQNGLPRLMQTLLAQGLSSAALDGEVRKFKAFYFSKKVAPLDYAQLVTWERETAAAGRAASEPVCPFTGAVGVMPADHPPVASVKQAYVTAAEPRCPFMPAGLPAATGALPAADAGAHLQLTRARTGLAHVRIVLSDVMSFFDPHTVATLGNHLVTCLLDRSVTALQLTFAVANGMQPPFFVPEPAGMDARLEAWSLRHGPVETAEAQHALRNELRLVCLMHEVSRAMPTIAIVDAPLFGVAVPLALACRFRVGSQRTEMRLSGCSQLGILLGVSGLTAAMRHYLCAGARMLFAADLHTVGLLTDFVPRHLHGALDTSLAAAAACPPPHTDKAVKKTINDTIEAPGPSRLRTFALTIETAFVSVDTTAYAAALAALPPTPWADATQQVLAERLGPLLDFALQLGDACAGLESVAQQACVHYERATGAAIAAKVFEERAGAFDLPGALPPRPVQATAAWLVPAPPLTAVDEWRRLIEAREDFGPVTPLEQAFYHVTLLVQSDRLASVGV